MNHSHLPPVGVPLVHHNLLQRRHQRARVPRRQRLLAHHPAAAVVGGVLHQLALAEGQGDADDLGGEVLGGGGSQG